MKKRLALSLLAVLILFVTAVQLPSADHFNAPQEKTPPASIRMMYRDAACIALATCMRMAPKDGDKTISRFAIDETLAGDLDVGAVVNVEADAVPGEQYLLYLKPFDTSELTEDTILAPVYDSLLISVNQGTVSFKGETCTLDSVRDDIEKQKAVLSVPSKKFYYNDFNSLIESCDAVLICRVLSVSEPTMTVCRSTGNGESTVNTLEQVFVRARVENPLFSGFKSGNKIDIVIEPHDVKPVINATDLTQKKVNTPPESTPTVGKVYIFFLVKSDDAKNNRFFTVNPYEGYVLLIGDSIIHPYYNNAFQQINDLGRFSELLKKALDEQA